jgi:hypothetical protein
MKRTFFAIGAVGLIIITVVLAIGLSVSAETSVLLSLNKPAVASSLQQDSSYYVASKAFDGLLDTRWSSYKHDPEWIYVDLQATCTIDHVKLTWHAGYGKAYQIQVSGDATNWTDIYSTTTGDGGVDDIPGLSGSGRYVRMYGTQRPSKTATYSLWEFEVYGYGCAGPTNTPVPPTNTPGGPTETPTPAPSGVLFDDFNYTSYTDPNLAVLNWTLRNGTGGPGVTGATWEADNITFLDDPNNPGNRLAQMRSETTGTRGYTIQSELFLPQKFLEGTYASRVFFNNAPVTGVDGDSIVETFFSITPETFDMDPLYSEDDFEYLPNGGWGANGPIMYLTTWETYQEQPWIAVNQSTSISADYQGWHTLVAQVANGHVKYYIDGSLVADHSGDVYPETHMSINYNLWFINGELVRNTALRYYHEQIDWLYYADGVAQSPTAVDAAVASFRAQSVVRTDSVSMP